MKKEIFRTYFNQKSITKFFFEVAEERYPSSEKLIQMASRIVDPMGGSDWESVNAKISILTIIRDMVKQVAPLQFYRSMQHRDDLFGSHRSIRGP